MRRRNSPDAHLKRACTSVNFNYIYRQTLNKIKRNQDRKKGIKAFEDLSIAETAHVCIVELDPAHDCMCPKTALFYFMRILTWKL